MTATMQKPRKTLPGVITKSQWLPPKMVVYGPPGIGKSSFAAGSPNPIFIPTEAGIENLDITRFPVASTLEEFIAYLRMIAYEEHDHKTVVIDTLNGLVDMYGIAKSGIQGYDFVGFGGYSGWSPVARDFAADIFEPLNECQRRGMHVVMLAHTGEYTRKNPVGDDLAVAAPSIPKWVWKAIHPWLDVIGRADYIYSTKGARTDRHGNPIGKAKASTVEESVNGRKIKLRQMIFDGGAEQDCKTRIGYELPATIDLSWHAFESNLGNVVVLANEVRELWQYLPSGRDATTLQWLGVKDIEDLSSANRANLSQLRNRLRDIEAQAVAEEQNITEQTNG